MVATWSFRLGLTDRLANARSVGLASLSFSTRKKEKQGQERRELCPERVELSTFRAVIWHSILLSYEHFLLKGVQQAPNTTSLISGLLSPWHMGVSNITYLARHIFLQSLWPLLSLCGNTGIISYRADRCLFIISCVLCILSLRIFCYKVYRQQVLLWRNQNASRFAFHTTQTCCMTI